jgi:cytochrome c biogenesis protein CcmG/thiol:disulfide interchange protein DsbE
MNFWAPTCVDCLVEHPFLLSAWRRYAPRGVVFLSVLHQDPEGLAQQFDRERTKPWPDLSDPGSRTALDYGVTGIPETVFIRPDGVVAHRIIGASSPSEVKAWIERILGRGATTS